MENIIREVMCAMEHGIRRDEAINDAAKEICMNGADVKTTLDKYAAQIAEYAEKAGY